MNFDTNALLTRLLCEVLPGSQNSEEDLSTSWRDSLEYNSTRTHWIYSVRKAGELRIRRRYLKIFFSKCASLNRMCFGPSHVLKTINVLKMQRYHAVIELVMFTGKSNFLNNH